MKVARALGLVLGFSCAPPLSPSMDFITPYPSTAVTDSAASRAWDCGIQGGLTPIRRVADLRLYVVRGRTFDLEGHWSDDHEYTYYGYTTEGRVYIAEYWKGLVAIWSHEDLHSLFGLGGLRPEDHHPIFAACGLDVIGSPAWN